MFSIFVETSFKASHQLTLPDGSKEPLHEHNWQVISCVSSKKLDNMGLVMDFHMLKTIVNKSVSELENNYLNKLSYFQINNPSAEAVSEYIFGQIEKQLGSGVKLESVKVMEEYGCWSKFSK